MPRRSNNKKNAKVGGQASYRGPRLEPQVCFAFTANPEMFELARQMARMNNFWPEGYPLPEALEIFDLIHIS